jgi:hypothetical protein
MPLLLPLVRLLGLAARMTADQDQREGREGREQPEQDPERNRPIYCG